MIRRRRTERPRRRNENLPEEIIEDILSRLPTKPLLRFKCVSKFWYNLISSRKFAKQKHLARTLSNPSENPFRVLIYWPFESLDYESLSSLEGAPEDGANKFLDDPLGPHEPDPGIYRLVIGSCDGIIVILYEFEKIVLWNPSIKVARELPPVSLSLSLSLLTISSSQNATVLYGFGYDDLSDDYKVVEVVQPSTTNETTAYVFSTKDDSWRTIRGPNNNIIVPNKTSESCYLHGSIGVFLHRALHWLANGSTILRFDLTTERFSELTTLPTINDADRKLEYLWTLNDRLSLLSTSNLGSFGVDVWVMNEYGNNQSWSKLFSTNDEIEYAEFVAPLCFARNGDVIMNIDGYYSVRYNVQQKTFQYLKTEHGDKHQASFYVQSLVSPYANNFGA